MRITLNLDEDALIAARKVAQSKRMSLGAAVSALIRRGTANALPDSLTTAQPSLRGRFALLPVRDEVITPQHIRELMGQDSAQRADVENRRLL